MQLPKLASFLTLIVLVLMTSQLISQESELELTYLGAAGWKLISSNGTTILIDPYITRKRYGQIRDSVAVSNTELIDKHIEEADFILIHHGHPDHLLDVPYIAKKTGAKVIGTETTMNILRPMILTGIIFTLLKVVRTINLRTSLLELYHRSIPH